MLRSALIFQFWLLLLLPLSGFGLEKPPEPPREFRAAWVATVYNLDWPSKRGLSGAAQREELRAILDRAVELRMNAILLQVRPQCDALYESKLEPWSAFLSGTMGQAPDFDPLDWAVTEAHARGLELHAWFNPFRALASADMPTSANHVSRAHPNWVRRYGSQLILDPGDPAVRDYVRSVILDVVRRYDIDGVHIDDYFYPYPVKDKNGGIVPFPDDAAWQRYQSGGGKLGRADWRRDNINQFVEGTYRAIKNEKRWVKFGISPFGIWRPRVPETIQGGLDAYDQLYADSRKWLSEGWCDYFSPQLYWSIEPAAQSFPVLLDWWSQQNRSKRHLWPGIATERIGAKRPAKEIIQQISITRDPPALSVGKNAAPPGEGTTPVTNPGHIHWDMKSLMRDQGGIRAQLRDTYRDFALIPPSPWLGAEAPAAPKIERDAVGVNWKSSGDIPARWWLVQRKLKGAGWRSQLLPARATSIPMENGVEALAVRCIDRFGNASPPAQLAL